MPQSAVVTSASFATAALWTPADLGSALVAWWHADDLADGAVASWAPRAGSLTLAQATGSLQPVRAAASFNAAYAGVTFDGTDDYLTVEATTGLPTGTTAGEIWLVVDKGAAVGNRVVLRYGGASAGQFRSVSLSASVGTITDGTTPVSFTMATFAIIGAFFGATQYGGRQNGTDLTPSGAATLNTLTTRTRMGSATGAGPGNYWQGTIRHALVTTTLTLADRERLEGYFAYNAGLQSVLPTDHPYKVTPPAEP
jgi:hypothetical protein